MHLLPFLSALFISYTTYHNTRMSETTGRLITYPEYEDFISAMQAKGGPFKFVTQRKDFPIGGKVGTTPSVRSLAEIEKSVMESPRVKNAITEESIQRKCNPEEVRKEALAIIREMAHQFNLTNVRSLGYFVLKALEKLYDNVYVNDQKLKEIRERSKKDCVVFMPSHKTYFDFILLSLVCFLYDIQLPAIAAGMDFMSMKFIGEVLRRSGAFFMRRSFGDDQLYWAVFSEYVQTHVVNNDRTVEFFVEATRSRVGKSLHPKYGMLQMILEPYLRGSVYDIVIVPVSMNYDKILEEKLYAYELLGFPKPKESTSGLFKAREILKKKNGNCFMTFGDPISVRDYFGTSLHRSSFVCQPDSQFVLDTTAKTSIRNFAHHVVGIHNQNAVITIWNIACMVMLQKLDENDDSIFTYSQLTFDVHNLVKVLDNLQTIVNIQKNLDYDLRYYVAVHDDLFEPFNIKSGNFNLKLIDFPVVQEKSGVPKKIMERAVSRLILTTYSNAMVHAIDSEAILCKIVEKTSDKVLAKKQFGRLHNLMKREFVTTPGQLDQLFDRTLKKLTDSLILSESNNCLQIVNVATSQILIKLIMPYFRHFETVFNCFEASTKFHNLNDFIPIVQKRISEIYQDDNNSKLRLSFLSTEPIKNAFAALIDLGALRKRPRGFEIDNEKLNNVRKELSSFTAGRMVSKL